MVCSPLGTKRLDNGLQVLDRRNPDCIHTVTEETQKQAFQFRLEEIRAELLAQNGDLGHHCHPDSPLIVHGQSGESAEELLHRLQAQHLADAPRVVNHMQSHICNLVLQQLHHCTQQARLTLERPVPPHLRRHVADQLRQGGPHISGGVHGEVLEPRNDMCLERFHRHKFKRILEILNRGYSHLLLLILEQIANGLHELRGDSWANRLAELRYASCHLQPHPPTLVRTELAHTLSCHLPILLLVQLLRQHHQGLHHLDPDHVLPIRILPGKLGKGGLNAAEEVLLVHHSCQPRQMLCSRPLHHGRVVIAQANVKFAQVCLDCVGSELVYRREQQARSAPWREPLRCSQPLQDR
mmetsp:Transcript_36382/g.79445  ORF Transcript_36382/g.79445 Transcript_36382/m.79445 type:complete len:353 (-) Transcript_36382:406-1464(-)